MSTSIGEMVEHHRTVSELYAEAAKQYPNATIQDINNRTVVYSQSGVAENRIMVVGDRLVPYERIDGPSGWIPAVGSMWRGATIDAALEHLRETTPTVYTGLIEWMKR